jgi:hypothetical protein
LPGTTNIIQAAAPILPAPVQYQMPVVAPLVPDLPRAAPRRSGTLPPATAPPAYDEDRCNPRTCRRPNHHHGTGWNEDSWGGRRLVHRSPCLPTRYSCLSREESGDDLNVAYHRGREEIQFPGSTSGGRYQASALPRDSKSPPTPEELQERLSHIDR